MPVRAAAALVSREQVRDRNRRARLEERAAEEAAQLSRWFSTYDTSKDGAFDREEMRGVLTEAKRSTLGDASAVVRDEVLDNIMNRYDANGNGQLDRSEVLAAVKKYMGFIKHEGKMEAILRTFDADKSGTLNADELLPVLQRVAADEQVKGKHKYTDGGRGHAVSDGVGEADVAFILARCDGNKSGDISVEELGPALAEWKEAAKGIKPEKAPSTACVVL